MRSQPSCRSRVRLTLVILSALVMGACAAEEPSTSSQPTQQPAPEGDAAAEATSSPRPAEFVAVDFDFPETPTELPSGQVEFELVNDGGVVHNITIEELDDTLVVTAQPGQTNGGTVDLTPGTYTYYCSISGHRALGMEGTITVG